MPELALHHVSVIVSDLARSTTFYCDVFGLASIARPPFATAGTWLACGDLQIHLVAYPGTFRTIPGIDNNDWHFAFRTDDFDAVLARLNELGFSDDRDEDDPLRLLVYRNGLAGFAQLYLRDPDRNIIEINAAP